MVGKTKNSSYFLFLLRMRTLFSIFKHAAYYLAVSAIKIQPHGFPVPVLTQFKHVSAIYMKFNYISLVYNI